MKYRKIIMMIFLVLIAMISVGCENNDSGTEGLIYEQLEWKYEYAVTGYEGDSETVVVPETYNGMPVTTIKTGALTSDTITSITLPDTITYLEEDSINTGNMESFTIPVNVSYFAQAFTENRSDIDIIIPSNHTFLKKVKICGHEAIVSKDKTVLIYVQNNDDSDTIFNLPDNYIELAPCAFKGTTFKEINIPESVISIGIGAFKKVICDKITIDAQITKIASETFIDMDCPSVVLPDTVEEIGEYAFSGSSLSSLIFPTALKTIKYRAFYNSDLSGALVLPEGLEVIEDEAFSNCLLTSIELPSTLTDLSSDFFGNDLSLSNLNNVTWIRFKNISFTDMDLYDYFHEFIRCNYLYDGYGRPDDPDYVVTIIKPQDRTEAANMVEEFMSAWENIRSYYFKITNPAFYNFNYGSFDFENFFE